MGGFLGLRSERKKSPRGKFSSQERSLRGWRGRGRGEASVSHITNTRPLHFIPHSFGGGEERRHSYLGKSETQIILNPALFPLIVWTSWCLENTWTFFRGSSISGNETPWIHETPLFLEGFPTFLYGGFSLQREGVF